ncbi:MAG: TRAP transporter fused permease subunit [Proteobacteria bacterium]|nr:TRAP transporter fused permease subunit [Pseudomonadota bacterium]MBU4383927.1 TRAP transporter fused permease subunit [Pseudomonadota bacterium]MCG2763567.1 TRAP transporter fused permease subunit [Desulfarculaceae bacterium]
MNRILKYTSSFMFFALAFSSLYSASIGLLPVTYHRGLVLGVSIVGLLLAGVSKPSVKLTWSKRLLLSLDLLMAVVFSYGIVRFVIISEALVNDIIIVGIGDMIFGLIAIMIVIELTRRLFGPVLAGMAAIGVIYCFIGPYLPSFLFHSGFSLDQIIEATWFSFQGVFGLALGVTINTILIFIVFGVILEGTGAADSLMRVAFSLTGGLRGGPAYAAVVSSCMFGTMSGSVTANVVGTGTFTIPMIKRRGFSPTFAGALEATASTGGQIVPPVMGAAAFLMADLTGTPYTSICIAAIVPAFLYYTSLFLAINVEVRRCGIEGASEEERAKLTRTDILNSLMFVGPILAIIVFLVAGRSPSFAGFWAVVLAIVLGFINPEVRKNPVRLAQSLVKAGRTAATIVVAVATIGIILAVLNQTGVGLTFASIIGMMAEGSLFLALLAAAGASLVLGMGMPTLPAYLIIILVLGPGIKLLGGELIAVHLFVLYFAVLSAITPPVALAAFAAAPIALANPLRIGARAISLAAVAFIVAFMFVYEPSLLLIVDFEWNKFLWAISRILLAAWLLTSGFSGYDRDHLPIWNRIIRVCSAFVMLTIWPIPNLIAFGIGILFFLQYLIPVLFPGRFPGQLAKKKNG